MRLRPRSLVHALSALLLCLSPAVTPPPASAQAPAAPSPAALVRARATAPESVHVGIYVRDIYDVDLKNGTYEVDFDLWMEWSGDIDPTGFVILNGKKDEQEKVAAVTGSEEHSVLWRCQYRFHEALDRAQYPLDAHQLTIRLEDGQHTAREMLFVPDLRWRPMSPLVKIPGWAIGPPVATSSVHLYPAEAGAGLTPDQVQEFSLFEVRVPLRRPDAGIFLKTFLVLFISVAVGLLAHLLLVRQVEARLGLGLASVFGVVSSYVVAAGNLPESGELTLSDKLHIAGMAFVFLSILASVAVFRLADRLGDTRTERLDRWLGVATTVGYAAAVVLLCLTR